MSVLFMKDETVAYPQFSLRLIEASSADDVPAAKHEEYCRVELPCASSNYTAMRDKGFLFVDRTIGVSINLKRNDMDYQKLIRFEIRQERADDASILEIALNSFPSDRRFHIRPVPDDTIAGEILRGWVEKLSEVYVCLHKGEIVGFVDLEPWGEGACFIHLAAVRERYRAAGAAVSMYAFAVQKAKEKGCERICGRISSSNTAVMNLYARLGASFSDPLDVFVRNEV